MALFFICGTPGTGKSSVFNILKNRSFEAHDVDDYLARWRHNQTGYIHPKSSVKSHQRTPEFLEEHSWVIPRKAVEDLALKAARKPIFLCGSLGNEQELHDLFDTVFALYVDDETLKHRLATRSDNDWGKQPHELQQTLKLHHQIYKQHKRRGNVIIDASKSLDEVVSAILIGAGL